MINYKQGDLIEGLKNNEVFAIGHQSNCMNTMGSGVALAVKKAFPEAYEADCQTRAGDYDKLGTLTWVIVPTNDPELFGFVFNLYGQYNYGKLKNFRYTDMDALESALRQMRVFLDATSVTKVGFPKIGCGTGGADWDEVEALLIEIFDGLEVTVYIKE